MHPSIAEKLEDIKRICREHGVKRLEIFGSAARGEDFDPSTSDVDFLVEFEEGVRKPWLGHYRDLEAELAAMLGRPVDLVPAKGEGNPRIIGAINRDRQMVYAN